MVKIKDQGVDHIATMFSSTLDNVVDTVGSAPATVSRALISLPKMVFTINIKNVVVKAVKKSGDLEN
jgi:hypothetical protein